MTSNIADDDQQFRLVFPGNILPGSDIEKVVLGLSRLLKTTPDSARRLVSGKKRVVKRAFIYEKADQLRVQVLQLGVECELEQVDPDTGTAKSKKKKRKKHFPSPDNIAMQPATQSQADGTAASTKTGGKREKSYSETMAEFQEYSSTNRIMDDEHAELDVAAMSFNTEKNVDSEQDSKNGSVSSKNLRRWLAQFVGENVDNYLPKFDKFQQGGGAHFVFTWHWPAFFVPFFWAIYRKLWVWSVIILISQMFLPLASNVLWGITAYYIYFRKSMKKIRHIRKLGQEDEINEKLMATGGTSTLALSAALLIVLLLMNGVYWSSKLSPVFSTLSENLEKIEHSTAVDK